MKTYSIIATLLIILPNLIFSQKMQMDNQQRIIYYENYLKSDYGETISNFYSIEEKKVDQIVDEVCAFLALERKSKNFYFKQTSALLRDQKIITKREKNHFNKMMKFLSEEEYFSFWETAKNLYGQEQKSDVGKSYCFYYDAMAGAFGFDSFYHMAQQFLDLAAQGMMPSIDLMGDFGIPYADQSIFGGTPIDIEGLLNPPISNVMYAGGGGGSGSSDNFSDEVKAAYVATYTLGVATATAGIAGAVTAASTSPSGPGAVAAGGAAAKVGFEVGLVVGAAVATTHIAILSYALSDNKSSGNFMDPCASRPPEDCHLIGSSF